MRGCEITLSSGAICVELVHKLHVAGCNFVEAPVRHHPRLHGRSQFFTPRRVAHTLRDFALLWWQHTSAARRRPVREGMAVNEVREDNYSSPAG